MNIAIQEYMKVIRYQNRIHKFKPNLLQMHRNLRTISTNLQFNCDDLEILLKYLSTECLIGETPLLNKHTYQANTTFLNGCKQHNHEDRFLSKSIRNLLIVLKSFNLNFYKVEERIAILELIDFLDTQLSTMESKDITFLV